MNPIPTDAYGNTLNKGDWVQSCTNFKHAGWKGVVLKIIHEGKSFRVTVQVVCDRNNRPIRKGAIKQCWIGCFHKCARPTLVIDTLFPQQYQLDALYKWQGTTPWTDKHAFDNAVWVDGIGGIHTDRDYTNDGAYVDSAKIRELEVHVRNVIAMCAKHKHDRRLRKAVCKLNDVLNG